MSDGGGEIEIGRLLIRRMMDDEGDVYIHIDTSEGLPLIDALGMAAFAQAFLPEIYDHDCDHEHED